MGRLHRQPDQRYDYVFHPLKGTPQNLDRIGDRADRDRRAPSRCTATRHDVFFNRGVASSQAYTEDFGNTPIADLEPDRQKQALGWLSRDLDDALLRFIDQTAAR